MQAACSCQHQGIRRGGRDNEFDLGRGDPAELAVSRDADHASHAIEAAMTGFLAQIVRPDGSLPRLGDDDGGHSILYRRCRRRSIRIRARGGRQKSNGFRAAN